MPHKPNILILEDRPADAELMSHELRSSGLDADVTVVENMPDFVHALDAHPDLILADFTLREFNAEEALQTLHERGSEIPVIIVSGTIHEEKAVECMRMGAVDYILKDRIARLGPAARHALDAHEERMLRERAEHEMAIAQRVANLGSWRLDLDSNKMQWSLELHRILRHEDARGPLDAEGMAACFGQGGSSFVSTGIEMASQGRSSGPLELEVRSPSGAVAWVEARIEPVLGEAGGVVAVRGTFQDITPRRIVEAQRLIAEHQYRTLVESVPDGIFRLSQAGRFEYVNPAGIRLLGFETLEGLTAAMPGMRDAVVDQGEWDALVDAVLRGRFEPVTLELRARSGHTFWVSVTPAIERDAHGDLHVQGILHDVSAERARTELMERLAAIVESTDEAIFSIDQAGTVLSWNGSATQTFGFPRYEAVGRCVLDFLVPADKEPEWQEAMKLTRAGEHVGRFETERLHRDGRRLPVALTMGPIHDAGGSVVAVSVVEHDMTDAKRAEAAQRELEEQQQEVERLRTLSEMRMEFLNVAAHDLNTPLTPLLIQIAMLRKSRTISGRDRQSLDVLDRNIQRFKVMVQDMLDSARLQAGKLGLNRTPVDIVPLIDDVVRVFEEPATQSGLTIEMEEMHGLVADADPARVSQVLYNLVSNAIRYSLQGGTIRIGARHDGDQILVQVKDGGLGIEPDWLPNMFAPFARFHEGVAGVPRGTGLGLYISQGIVEQHGGRIWAESDGAGKGSTFSFSLPVKARASGAGDDRGGEAAAPVEGERDRREAKAWAPQR